MKDIKLNETSLAQIKENKIKYFDYVIFIMGAASLIISWIDNTSVQHLFSGFGGMMMIYSGMNISERYKTK